MVRAIYHTSNTSICISGLSLYVKIDDFVRCRSAFLHKFRRWGRICGRQSRPTQTVTHWFTANTRFASCIQRDQYINLSINIESGHSCLKLCLSAAIVARITCHSWFTWHTSFDDSESQTATISVTCSKHAEHKKKVSAYWCTTDIRSFFGNLPSAAPLSHPFVSI